MPVSAPPAIASLESSPTVARHPLRIGINGFGRIGRLATRIAFERASESASPSASPPESTLAPMRIVRVNDPAADASTAAHLLAFDSVHGRWHRSVSATSDAIIVDGHAIAITSHKSIADTPWSDCDIVIESSGTMKTVSALDPYFAHGVRRVVVTAPVKDPSVLNVVMGVNHERFDPSTHRIVTAASCTTNCLAPIVKVIHATLGIRHGSITTIHDLTNTQSILDRPHKDLRRARASHLSLIPTTTGSATAITEIFPELKGRLNGHAVRVPLANASLTDCVFEVERPTTAEEVNGFLRAASEGELRGILGYEPRPLVSIDYRTDPRSAIVDALSTMVVNGTQVKIYAWYDNEWGYSNRTVELAALVGATADAPTR